VFVLLAPIVGFERNVMSDFI